MRIEIASDHNICISIEEWIKNSLVNVFLLSKKCNDLFKFSIFYFPIISYTLASNQLYKAIIFVFSIKQNL